MKKLNYELKQLGLNNRDGSYATRAKRARTLSLAANHLRALGFRHMRATSLKAKHVNALVEAWRNGDDRVGINPVSVGTLENRLSALRWWASKVGRSGVMPPGNDGYELGTRGRVAPVNKAVSVSEEVLLRVRDRNLRVSLELQAAFGLRREEAIKFVPSYADRVDRIELKPTWTKGGKARTVPVRTETQRELLLRAHEVAGRGSLIPSDRRYIDQLRIYERVTANLGLSKLHGLRHAYAQTRYLELTGWAPPVAGGPSRTDFDPIERGIDRAARLTISKELGHEREQITAVYLGR